MSANEGKFRVVIDRELCPQSAISLVSEDGT
jgi:hypothetical protein